MVDECATGDSHGVQRWRYRQTRSDPLCAERSDHDAASAAMPKRATTNLLVQQRVAVVFACGFAFSRSLLKARPLEFGGRASSCARNSMET